MAVARRLRPLPDARSRGRCLTFAWRQGALPSALQARRRGWAEVRDTSIRRCGDDKKLDVLGKLWIQRRRIAKRAALAAAASTPKATALPPILRCTTDPGAQLPPLEAGAPRRCLTTAGVPESVRSAVATAIICGAGGESALTDAVTAIAPRAKPDEWAAIAKVCWPGRGATGLLGCPGLPPPPTADDIAAFALRDWEDEARRDAARRDRDAANAEALEHSAAFRRKASALLAVDDTLSPHRRVAFSAPPSASGARRRSGTAVPRPHSALPPLATPKPRRSRRAPKSAPASRSSSVLRPLPAPPIISDTEPKVVPVPSAAALLVDVLCDGSPTFPTAASAAPPPTAPLPLQRNDPAKGVCSSDDDGDGDEEVVAVRLAGISRPRCNSAAVRPLVPRDVKRDTASGSGWCTPRQLRGLLAARRAQYSPSTDDDVPQAP